MLVVGEEMASLAGMNPMMNSGSDNVTVATSNSPVVGYSSPPTNEMPAEEVRLMANEQDM